MHCRYCWRYWMMAVPWKSPRRFTIRLRGLEQRALYKVESEDGRWCRVRGQVLRELEY